MKKQLLPGLIALLALGLPVASQAQMSNPSATTPMGGSSTMPPSTMQQPTDPYQTTPSMQPSPLQQTGQFQTPPSVMPPSPMQQTGQTQPMPSVQPGMPTSVTQQTQTTTTTTQVGASTPSPASGEVIVGKDSASSIVPPLTIGQSTTLIRVVNPTPKPVSFSVPTLSMTYAVPANSERTIQIDRAQTASLTPGQVITYYVNDASGNQIASSNLTNYNSVASQMNTNTTVAAEQKPEPSYTSAAPEKSSTPRRSTVRGYW